MVLGVHSLLSVSKQVGDPGWCAERFFAKRTGLLLREHEEPVRANDGSLEKHMKPHECDFFQKSGWVDGP